MGMQTYASPVQRIGAVKGDIIGHAMAVECLGITGQEKKIGKNKSQTIKFRQWLPYGATDTAISGGVDPRLRPSVSAAAHLLSEGVTPTADKMTPRDISVTIKQYGFIYQWSDWVENTYEDDMPMAAREQVGERTGLLREMIRYGALKGATNKFYAGGTTRATVDEPISLNLLRRITRSIKGNHGTFVRSIIDPGMGEGTAPIEASYLVFAHTDCESDIRDLPKFTPVAEYGKRVQVHENEIGSCENFRFILSPELASYADAATSTTASTAGLYSTTGSYPDVYPVIVTAKDAWYQTSLMGDALDPTSLPAGKKDKSDPLGQRGYVGATFWFTSDVINEGWMAVAEVGVSTLT